MPMYARLAPLSWRVKRKEVCKNCRDKSCISSKNLYKFQSKSCGVNLVPQQLEDNTNCLLCGQCLKACDLNNPGQGDRPNPGWFKRQFAKDLLDLKPLSMAQAVFVLVVSGFVIYEIAVEYSITKKLLLYVPGLFIKFFNLNGTWAKGITESLTIFFILPAIIWFIPFGLARLGGVRTTFSNYMKNVGISFIPIMAAGHIIKSIAKSTSRIPYWKHSLSDPIGYQAAQAIQNKSIQLTGIPQWGQMLITVIVIVLIILALFLNLVIIKKILAKHFPGRKGGLFYYFISFLYGGSFIAMIIIWRF